MHIFRCYFLNADDGVHEAKIASKEFKLVVNDGFGHRFAGQEWLKLPLNRRLQQRQGSAELGENRSSSQWANYPLSHSDGLTVYGRVVKASERDQVPRGFTNCSRTREACHDHPGKVAGMPRLFWLPHLHARVPRR